MTSIENEPTAIPGAAAAQTAIAQAPSRLLLAVIGIATGALAANLYYAQPLIAQIGPEIGIRPDLAGVLVSVTQIGYALGLFFLVSLADLVESKRLVLIAMCVTVLALLAAATSPGAAPLFIASLVIGLSSTSARRS